MSGPLLCQPCSFRSRGSRFFIRLAFSSRVAATLLLAAFVVAQQTSTQQSSAQQSPQKNGDSAESPKGQAGMSAGVSADDRPRSRPDATLAEKM